jgi:hypothetical protein
VQKTRVTACRGIPDATGQQAEGSMEVTDVGPMPRDLLALADGWTAGGSTPVAMERPGEDWRPVDHLVEGDFTVCLGNAAHVPQGPGRQTRPMRGGGPHGCALGGARRAASRPRASARCGR